MIFPWSKHGFSRLIEARHLLAHFDVLAAENKPSISKSKSWAEFFMGDPERSIGLSWFFMDKIVYDKMDNMW